MVNNIAYWRDIFLNKKVRYIHGLLNGTLKVYDMVYQPYFKRNMKRS